MSGFDTSWLDLREPADIAARDAGLLSEFAASLRHISAPRITDLGSGTGSTLRAVKPMLPSAHWRLTDHDPALLIEARQRHPEAVTEQIDLAENLEQALEPESDAITASALIDLVSETWLERLVSAARGRSLYIALSFNGEERWLPECDTDAEIFAAFNAHQRGDKGFGPALGPEAAPCLARLLEAENYSVRMVDSPWKLQSGALMQSLAEGIAVAAQQSGVADHLTQSWLANRKAALECRVGHVDLHAVRL